MNIQLGPSPLLESSRAQWIKARLTARTWSLSRLDLASVTLGGLSPDLNGGDEDKNIHEGWCTIIRFSRSAFTAMGPGVHVLALVGHTHDGVAVAGTGTITIIGPGQRRERRHMMIRPLAGPASAQRVMFTLSVDSDVTVDVLDIQGRVVDRISSGFRSAGDHEVQWTGSSRVSSGVYFLRVRAAGEAGVAHIVVAR